MTDIDLQSVLDTQKEMICRFTAVGKILFVNKAYADALKSTVDDLIGKNLWSFVSPADRSAVQTRLSALSLENPIMVIENRFDSATGTIWTEWRNLAIAFDKSGVWIEAQSTGVDITDRKRATDALIQSESKYRELLEKINQGFCVIEMVYDASGEAVDYRFLEVNRMFEEHTGLHNAVGKSALELRPDFEKKWVDIYHQVARSGETLKFEQGSVAMDRLFEVEAVRVGEAHARRVALLFSDVTDTRRSEALLRDNESKLRLGLAVANIGLGYIDYVQDTVTLDENLASVFEIASATPIPRSTLYAKLHPDDASLLDAKFKEALRHDTSDQLEIDFRVLGSNGHIRWLSIRKLVTFDNSPNEFRRPQTGLLAAHDITDRIEATQALRAAEDSFRHLVEHSPFGVYAVDADFRLVLVSDGAKSVFSNVKPLIGRDFAEVLRILWPEPFASEVIDKFHHTLISGVPFHSPSTIERRDDTGDIESYDWKIERVMLPDGRLGVVCHFYDLSERARYEMNLQQSEQRLNIALDAARAGPWQLDFGSREFTLSDRAARLIGMQHGDRVPLNNLLASIESLDIPKARLAIENCFESGTPFSSEFKVVELDGSERWLLAQAELHESDNARELVGLLQDITERKHFEQKTRLLMAEVNHRSKNLLAVIQSVVRQTARGGNPESIADRVIGRISALAANQDLLVKNDWQGINVEDLLVQQLAHFRELLGNRITLAGPSLRLSPAAAQGLGMAIHELATNASKYGALSCSNGHVKIGWNEIKQPERMFTIKWQEMNGPRVSPPTRMGFGYTVIVNMAEASVQGKAEMKYPETGVVWELTAPLKGVIEPLAGKTSQGQLSL